MFVMIGSVQAGFIAASGVHSLHIIALISLSVNDSICLSVTASSKSNEKPDGQHEVLEEEYSFRGKIPNGGRGLRGKKTTEYRKLKKVYVDTLQTSTVSEKKIFVTAHLGL